MNYADDEKLRLLRWILPQLSADEIVAAELPYRDVGRKADLAILSPDRLVAIEIKGPRDRLDSLAAQVDDYLEAFLEVDVAVSTRFLQPARDALPKSVGLIELGEGFVLRRRRAAIRSTLTPAGSLRWLRAKELQRLLAGAVPRNSDIATLRQHAASSVAKSVLSNAAVKSAWQRSLGRYSAFQSERSNVLTLGEPRYLPGDVVVHAHRDPVCGAAATRLPFGCIDDVIVSPARQHAVVAI
jgi:hypothetical protein